MATSPSTPGKPAAAAEQASQDLAQEYRRVIGNALTAIRGQEALESFSARTFEDALTRQIAEISGDPGNGRANALDRVHRVASELRAAAEKIRATPPSAFADHDPDKDTNTALK